MSLNRETLKLDRMGIFPASSESAKQHILRGNVLLDESARLQRHIAETRFGGELDPYTNHKQIDWAVGKLKQRYGVDLSWVRIYTAYLGDPFLSEGAAGMCVPPQGVVPPFVVLNSFTLPGRGDTLVHEMTHLPRVSSFDFDVIYARTHAFEERLARSHSIGQLLVILPENFDYLKAKYKLWRAFGEKAGYVLMRMSYDEIKDFLIDDVLNIKGGPRDLIARLASKGYLKFQVINEVVQSTSNSELSS